MSQQILQKVSDLFYKTNYANLFSFPGLFTITAAVKELETKRYEEWLDKLDLPVVDNVWINSVNTKTDQEEIYSLKDFQQYGYGLLSGRSISIPGFITNPPHIDGGVAQNPCISQWENDKDGLPIFVSQLMMPWQLEPKGRIETLTYSWEFKAFQYYQIQYKRFKEELGLEIETLYPMIDDISSTDFGLSEQKKRDMVKIAYNNICLQLDNKGYIFGGPAKKIKLALSGGGIRSGGHIGVYQALQDYNLEPVKWSGTSGGSAFAIMFAGYTAQG